MNNEEFKKFKSELTEEGKLIYSKLCETFYFFKKCAELDELQLGLSILNQFSSETKNIMFNLED